MDDVPQSFIDSVLTVLDEEEVDVIRANLRAPLWKSAAENHLRKRDFVTINLAVKENETLFFFCRHAKGEISFDELLQLDVRFVRIVEFTVSTYKSDHPNAPDMVEMPAERLTELMRFVSHVPVLSCSILVESSAFLKRLAEELVVNPIAMKWLVLEQFPDEHRAELEALACSSIFESLTISGKKPQFDFPTLIRLVEAWKTRPGRCAMLTVPTSGNLAANLAR